MKYMMLLVDAADAWEKLPEAKRNEVYTSGRVVGVPWSA